MPLTVIQTNQPALRVGDLSIISYSDMNAILNSNHNRSGGRSWTSDSFTKAASELVGKVGVVTHIFPPGHETTVCYEGKSMHMPLNFHSRLVEKVGDFAIVYPSYFKRPEVEEGGSLFGYFRVTSLKDSHETSLYTMAECREIIKNAEAGALKGSFGL